MTNLCKKAAAVNIVWHFYKKKNHGKSEITYGLQLSWHSLL